jgi:hypothetical protein
LIELPYHYFAPGTFIEMPRRRPKQGEPGYVVRGNSNATQKPKFFRKNHHHQQSSAIIIIIIINSEMLSTLNIHSQLT